VGNCQVAAGEISGLMELMWWLSFDSHFMVGNFRCFAFYWLGFISVSELQSIIPVGGS
jgi:hypothetical protein